MLIFNVFVICYFRYAAGLSKLSPVPEDSLLEVIAKDYYYCYLIPLLILPVYVSVYLGWLSMRLFEHN